jgi:hypothetical protein
MALRSQDIGQHGIDFPGTVEYHQMTPSLNDMGGLGVPMRQDDVPGSVNMDPSLGRV